MTNKMSPSGTILVVDDSTTSRTWAKLRLLRAGYEVLEAKTAAEALGRISQQAPDLILLDVILPDQDGYAVTRQLRQNADLASIPVILLTSLEDVTSKVQGLEAGANDFLTKPPDEAELLARVETQLRLKRSREELLAEKSKTELLYRVSRELGAELDLDTLLMRLLELTTTSLDASGGSLILLDEQQRPVGTISSRQGQVTQISRALWEEVVREGLASWVIQHRQGTMIQDTQQDERWLVREDAHSTSRSVMAAPLIQEGWVVGVLTLTHEEIARFDLSHLDLVSSIATQAAVVIQKARVYRKEQLWARKLQFVNGVSHQVASILNPDQLLEDVAWLVRQTFGYYYVELALLDGDSLISQGWHSCRDPQVELSPTHLDLSSEGIMPWVARYGAPLLAVGERRQEFGSPHVDLPDTVAELGVPLRLGGEVLGVLDVQSDRHDQLGEADVPLLEILAAQISVALSNARLFEAVERERGRLEAILTGTADAIVTTDGELRITLLNPAAERAFGISFAQAAGRSIGKVLTPAALYDVFCQAKKDDGRSPPTELVLDDGRTLFFHVSPVAGPKGERGWVAVMQDITHLKELDQMKTDFVATVSHDLRSPLTSIRGYADLLLKSLVEGQHQEFVRYIKTSAEQMADLVQDLLDLGKIEAGVETVREACALNQLVQESLEAAFFQAELRKIALQQELPPERCSVSGDSRQLRQVLDNLLSNALKYSPVGGMVTVRLRRQDRQVLLEVQDSGIGIPQEALPRLFEKFYRVPSPQVDKIPGTGLGLAIVKAIVEAHDGQLWVESREGQGSRFFVALPAYANPGAATGPGL
ncbi:MAG: GAF domain-containing protein [Chloroflexia bacterium]|nr:GAF domain-containing protein [Chloroflexia bacterium]